MTFLPLCQQPRYDLLSPAACEAFLPEASVAEVMASPPPQVQG